MIKLSHLFTDTEDTNWSVTKNTLKSNIDTLLEKGKCDEDVLLLMKDLLDDIKISTSITDYIEEVRDGRK
ncbi:hypothetical protein JZU46_00270 [bacterium]|nr:hypothetical protein [bacterium]